MQSTLRKEIIYYKLQSLIIINLNKINNMIQNQKFKKTKELKCSIRMEVWVAVLKSGKKEKNKIIIVFVLMMKHRL